MFVCKKDCGLRGYCRWYRRKRFNNDPSSLTTSFRRGILPRNAFHYTPLGFCSIGCLQNKLYENHNLSNAQPCIMNEAHMLHAVLVLRYCVPSNSDLYNHSSKPKWHRVGCKVQIIYVKVFCLVALPFSTNFIPTVYIAEWHGIKYPLHICRILCNTPGVATVQTVKVSPANPVVQHEITVVKLCLARDNGIVFASFLWPASCWRDGMTMSKVCYERYFGVACRPDGTECFTMHELCSVYVTRVCRIRVE